MRAIGAAGAGVGAGAASSSSSPHYSGTRIDGTGLPPLHHIAMVVRDRDKTLANLSDTMGFGPAFPFEGNFPDAVLANGEKGLALKGAFVWMRNTALEVVEPMDDSSPHYAFLQELGKGLHHLAFWVDSVRGEIAMDGRRRRSSQDSGRWHRTRKRGAVVLSRRRDGGLGDRRADRTVRTLGIGLRRRFRGDRRHDTGLNRRALGAGKERT
ncbi:MAG: VOC family protein [Novosphingobium sp.]